MLRQSRYVVPNLITALNMFFGFMAIHFAIEGDFQAAIWSVYLATFLDLLDGRLARTLNASSKFGVEMDSFSDLITFGAAPSVLMHQVFFQDWGLAGLIISFLPMLFSAFRLARFNVEAGRADKRYMKGVPTPISAITLISYVAFALALWDDRAPQWLAALVVISVSLLMVSNLKFESNSISRPRDLGESWKILPFALSILSVIVYGPAALFLFALLYISIGLIRWVLEHRPRPDEATAF